MLNVIMLGFVIGVFTWAGILTMFAAWRRVDERDGTGLMYLSLSLAAFIVVGFNLARASVGRPSCRAHYHRCPGCGQFETIQAHDETVHVGNHAVTETIVTRYCAKCRSSMMTELAMSRDSKTLGGK